MPENQKSFDWSWIIIFIILGISYDNTKKLENKIDGLDAEISNIIDELDEIKQKLRLQ